MSIDARRTFQSRERTRPVVNPRLPDHVTITRGYLLLPYRQGELDGLCGLYAIINAIRVALTDRAKEFSDEDWQNLFCALLVAADDTVGAAHAAISGMETRPFVRILRTAVRHMLEEHDVMLEARRVLEPGERPSLAELLPRLRDMTTQPRSAVVLALRGYLDHWTVLRVVGAPSLSLFDSSQFRRVSIAGCRMSYEAPGRQRRQHIIHPTGVFHVSVA